MKEKLNILFLSAIDFKEKSIQVIRKTPEAYVEKGWDVDYVVGRDTCRWGNYSYEEQFDPDGVRVFRIEYPFRRIRDFIKIKNIRSILNKLSLALLTIKIAIQAVKIIRSKKIDIVYGYEVHGVLALGLLHIFGRLKGLKTIHRFQGSWLPEYFLKRKFGKIVFNLDTLIASYMNADAVIMTDDGTRGNTLYKHNKWIPILKFWVNGVDRMAVTEAAKDQIRSMYGITDELVFLSVSRLEDWKRVDRCIEIVRTLKEDYSFNKFKYIIVGGGKKREELERLVQSYRLEDHIVFTGPVENTMIKNFFGVTDFFFSMYNLSNVGNPLLEAIRMNKIIFTLNNGDTANWIKNEKNGFIFPVDNHLYQDVAGKLYELCMNPLKRDEIINNVKILERERLWTWEERLTAETDLATRIVLGGSLESSSAI